MLLDLSNKIKLGGVKNSLQGKACPPITPTPSHVCLKRIPSTFDYVNTDFDMKWKPSSSLWQYEIKRFREALTFRVARIVTKIFQFVGPFSYDCHNLGVLLKSGLKLGYLARRSFWNNSLVGRGKP